MKLLTMTDSFCGQKAAVKIETVIVLIETCVFTKVSFIGSMSILIYLLLFFIFARTNCKNALGRLHYMYQPDNERVLDIM